MEDETKTPAVETEVEETDQDAAEVTHAPEDAAEAGTDTDAE